MKQIISLFRCKNNDFLVTTPISNKVCSTILEFIRSGRVIITKPMKTLDAYMDEKDQNYSFTN